MKLLFLGDWCLPEKSARPRLEHDALAGAIAEADAVVINYEGPQVTPAASPIAKVGPHLTQSSDSPAAVAALGVTHASLANNHALDSGIGGLAATVSALEESEVKPFGFLGAGWGERRVIRLGPANAGGFALVTGAEREFTVAGDARAANLDPISLHQCVQTELEAGYTVIAVLHGGIEYDHLPPPHLHRLARWLIDCGVSAVVTHHPHVPGFVEYWQGCPIAWSLGDFWMPRPGPLPSLWRARGYGVLIELAADGKANVDMVPYALDYSKTRVRELMPAEQREFDEMCLRYHEISVEPTLYQKWWDELIEKKSRSYHKKYSWAFLPRRFWFRGFGVNALLTKWVRQTPDWALRQLNGLRCETHRELWSSSLEALAEKRPRGRLKDVSQK